MRPHSVADARLKQLAREGFLVLRGPDRLPVLARYFAPGEDLAAIRHRGWDVLTDRHLPADVVLLHPFHALVRVLEPGALEWLLTVNRHRREARADVDRLAGDLVARLGLVGAYRRARRQAGPLARW